jgi:uncharacterized membrane protein YbhN (UPF0104 family)
MIRSAKKRSWARFLRPIGTILSLALLAWLMARQDWSLVLVYLNRLPWGLLLAALLFYGVGQVLNALRWYILLRAQSVPIRFVDTLKIVLVGAFASNFLPSTIGGDVIRLVNIQPYTRNEGLSLASLILDRLVNMVAFVTVLPISFLTIPLRHIPVPDLAFGLVIPGIDKLKLFLRRIFKQFLDAYHLWANQPATVFLAFVVSWFSIFVIFLGSWSLITGLGVQVTLWQVMGVTALTYFVTLLPISINGIGLREFMITTLYVLLGAGVEQATMMALISRFLMMAVTLPGAVWLGEMSRMVEKASAKISASSGE